VLGYLATINAMLVVFNMIPAFPLDGGRVLRSILWKWKDDLQQATRIASQIGSAFGIVLIVVGVVSIMSGEFIGGLWWVLIGMFLRSAAQMSYQQVLVRRALRGEPVWRFMQREPRTVPPWVTLSEFVDDYVYRYHHKMFPVTQEDQLVGCVNTRQLRDIPREQWPMMRIEDILRPCSPENTIHPNEDAVSALARLHRVGESRLMVVERNRLLGIITLRDLLRFLAAKIELSADLDADQFEPLLKDESLVGTPSIDHPRAAERRV
jgi:CBS domain-containing protein